MTRPLVGLLLVLLSALPVRGTCCRCEDCPGAVVTRASAPQETAKRCPCCPQAPVTRGEPSAPPRCPTPEDPCRCCTENASVSEMLPAAAMAPDRLETASVPALEVPSGFAAIDPIPARRPDVLPLGPPGRAQATVVLLL